MNDNFKRKCHDYLVGLNVKKWFREGIVISEGDRGSFLLDNDIFLKPLCELNDTCAIDSND